MGAEETFLTNIDEEDHVGLMAHRASSHDRLQRKNKAAIERFLGRGRRANAVGILPRYYGELLTWALHRYVEQEGWRVLRKLGYHTREPVFLDVHTGIDSRENLLTDGQLLLEKGDLCLVVTVDVDLVCRSSVQIEGAAKSEKDCQAFIDGIMAIAREQNFYRGKNIELAGRIRFLNAQPRSWDSIVLDAQTKAEIRANTTEFLARRDLWSRFGIASRRGVLLAGEPGTGKTIICKALMSETEGITCIAASAYALGAEEYLTELYELAQDLCPCMVFIEDVDLIGQERMESGYRGGAALVSLLAALDGIEEKKEIVTVATTNCLDSLDKALRERPSRFDRVIKLSRPSEKERRALVDSLCQKIPLTEAVREYVARRTEGCTPAQLQEIVHSLVIEHPEKAGAVPNPEFSNEDVERAISRVNGKNGHRMGFGLSNDHNGTRLDATGTPRID